MEEIFYQNESDVAEDARKDVGKPDMWRVVLLNDDYTPRQFVVEILVSIFHKPPIEATKIMLDVHNKGRGLVGVYTYDIAKTRVAQLTRVARDKEYPLKAVIEED